jgi:hypothetical protein
VVTEQEIRLLGALCRSDHMAYIPRAAYDGPTRVR